MQEDYFTAYSDASPHNAAMETAILGRTDFQEASGARLRRLILALGYQFTEAAAIMGITKGVLNHWMEGHNPIQPYPMYRLCRAAGVNFDYVFLGDWAGLPGRAIRGLGNPLGLPTGANVEEDQREIEKPTLRRRKPKVQSS